MDTTNRKLKSCPGRTALRLSARSFAPNFGKSAVSPRRMLCFARRSVSKLYRLAHLFFNGTMSKLTADLNHDLRTKTHLGSLRHAGDSWRIKGLMMPNLLPGGRKYSSNKRWTSVEITSKLAQLTGKLWICYCFAGQKRTSQCQLKNLSVPDHIASRNGNSLVKQHEDK